MWTMFQKSVKSSIPTYNLAKEIEKSGFQGPPHIDFTRCTACGRCEEICPASALKIELADGYPLLFLHVGRCVFCGRCIPVCSERVIGVSRRFHWANEEVAGLVVWGQCGKVQANA